MVRGPYSNSTDVTGYIHSNGYHLCPTHAQYGQMQDRGNESGFVVPIFAGAEVDSQPICDVAGCDWEFDVTIIGED